MVVMPSNASNATVHYLAGRFPGRIAWLIGPSAVSKTKMRPWMPYALDNDAFSAWSKQRPWDAGAWRDALRWAKEQPAPPQWVLVPDVVTDRIATIANWSTYYPEVREYGWPVAFAVQDGMMPRDVPKDANVIFVGGSTEWKWSTLGMWCAHFRRVHVGRVNTGKNLIRCHDMGAESCDGTGWFRGTQDSPQTRDLLEYFGGARSFRETEEQAEYQRSLGEVFDDVMADHYFPAKEQA